MKETARGISKSIVAIATIVAVFVAAAGTYFVLVPGSRNSTTLVSTSHTTTGSNQTIILNGAGSTLIFPLMSVWTFTYEQISPNIKINYASVGSGAGIAQITARTVDFGATDAPMSAAQYMAIKNGTILTIPESASAVVPAYNLPSIGNGLRFTGDVLARIFLGNITMWNDPALVALNPGVNLPAHKIVVIHRSDGSGTMYTFTNFLSDSNAQWRKQVGFGTSVNWPTGIGCKGNEGVAGCILNTPYSIGPLEIAYVIVNKGLISYGAVRNAAGNFILANLTNTAAAVQAGAASGLPPGNAQWTNVSIVDALFNNTAATDAYPITTFTYLLVYQQQSDPVRGAALVDFLWWVINSGQQAGANLGYVPLPPNVVALDDATINSITYNGTPLHKGP